MAQLMIGRELPNLKITLGVDNKNANEDDEEELEIDVSGDDEEHKQNDKQDYKQSTILIADKFDIEKPKKYENKGGAFVTGLDLSSEAVQQKLEKRAHRFGLEGMPKHQITQTEIDSLYTSLGIDVKNLKASGKAAGIRLDAIHMRGVNEMSTKDVFDYFKEFGPASVEWINDFSCNVLWLDQVSACRALLTLSRLLIVRHRRKSENTVEKTDEIVTEEEKAREFEENEVVIMSEDESSDGDDEEEDDNQEPPQAAFSKDEQKMEVEQPEVEIPCDDIQNAIPDVGKSQMDASNVEVPVPPGNWRLGIPHPKAKALLLRFATKDDKKLPGAEKRSQYYQKYGNPNYGGLRGLISTSRKRRYFQVKQRRVSKKPSESDITPESSQQSENSETESSIGNDHNDSTKRLRMRMYADDEEKKRKKRLAAVSRTRNQQRNKRKSFKGSGGHIHDRLGKSKIEVSVINQDSVSDYTDDSRDSHDMPDDEAGHMAADKESHRSSVWKRLADSKSSRATRDSRTSSLNKRTDDLDLRHKIGISSSQRHESSQSVVHMMGDLRSRLNQLRKERENKHRSPLLIQVEND